MDATDRRSTAGIRQFESTAIAKLVARGVPKHVATAFVKIGLPKSGRVEQLRDTVCKMEYKKFFVESTVSDFKDPLRVGFYVPHIVESKETTFHCEFQMSDLESAKFSKLFPEFNIVAKGRTYNQHAFYANKRYAEAEVLMSMVYSDAKKTGLNPQSVIDLGGNDSWHDKRGRSHVHCDNPIMGARDKMRYEARAIFSGSDRAAICNKTFSQCEHQADYAIGVHSTYDMTPNQIAHAMHKKKVRRFFGVINYIPGIESKPTGVYESDGIEMKVDRPARGSATFSCGFRHDPSLRYSHNISTLRKYLHCQQQYTVIDESGNPHPYTFTVRSVRGNSVIFSIDDVPRGVNLNTSLWSQSSAKSYKISIRFLGVKDMEVDCEFFDRIVLRAASAKNDSQFDMVSLFRYAKSLRQRVSIGGIVLSSGFSFNPDDLVNATVAAYATAMAYRVERTAFFKQATAQIVHGRYKGFFRDIVTVAVDALEMILLAIPVAFAHYSGLTTLDRKIKELTKTRAPVTVDVVKPNAGKGMTYDASMFTKRNVYTRIITLRNEGMEVTPYSKYYGATLLPTRLMYGGRDTTFFSRGLVAYDPVEIPKSTDNLKIYNVGTFTLASDGTVESTRAAQYAELFSQLRMVKNADQQALVIPNGDRMYRLGLSSVDGFRSINGELMSFVPNKTPYIIFRGSGKYAVSLKPPKRYSEGCVGFYLFFESRVDSNKLVDKLESRYAMTGDYSEDQGTQATPDLPSYSAEEDVSWSAVPHSVNSSNTAYEVRSFADETQGAEFVRQAASRGEYYMSGALTTDQPPTPPDEHNDFIRDAVVPTLGSSVEVPDGEDISYPSEEAQELRTVSSGDVVSGVTAMEEYVRITDIVRSHALAGAKAVIDMARSAAAGDAPKNFFLTAASQLPGNLRAVDLDYDDDGPVLRDHFSKEDCEHMAVSDGVTVYDLLTDRPSAGVYVTSDSFLVFTGGSIAASVKQAQTISYECPVTCLDGIAGSGKTFHIVKNAKVGDVVLCETRYALRDTAADLHRIPGWRGHAYTVDAFLMHRQVSECNVLWVDEAFRLHAGKLYALIKLLKPKAVYCFGDSKQIPALSFTPGYEYEHHQYPFSSIVVKKDTWRFGADVCFALSAPEYYGYHATTNVPVLRSMHGPKSFVQGSFHNRHDSAVILTYTKTARDDLLNQGVTGVMTIGESQGKTFDHVLIFRDSMLNKALYYDLFQSLVAVTRHRRTCTYVTTMSTIVDDSAVAKMLRHIEKNGNEVSLSSHVAVRTKIYRDYDAYADRLKIDRPPSSDGESSLPPEVTSVDGDWELFSDNE